jgi:DNA invertase Pin-like site-specific DNA recombinase
MNTSECITPFHLGRQALVYVRQSSPHQTLTNRESLRLQYALRQRAQELGWTSSAIEVIDADLGRTGSTTAGRQGFKDLAARVTLGQVGIIFAYDVTRLARNCTDWYQLLDLCGYRHCLVGDQDGVYDPTTTNGRLILGLKGLISELELHTIRARLTAGILSKARRGELALQLPVGLVRDPLERVCKHPDQEVQRRIDLIFATFLRLGSVSKVVRRFNDEKLLIPRKDGFGDIHWRPPTVAAVISLLHNPAYAGVFAYGRTRAASKPGSAQPSAPQRLPRDQWKICIRDKYPAYIDWDTYERIQAMIRDNHSDYKRDQTRGVPRAGKALLHGLVYCGECGHKMFVVYKKGTRYLCDFLRQQHCCPVCQYLPGNAIDDHVVELFFAALAPAELDVFTKALAIFSRGAEQVQRARQQQLERLRYQARLAERQFNQADPDNRLVAAELERRWETALREVKEAEDAWDREQHQRPSLDELDAATKKAWRAVGQQIPELWRAGHFTQQQKKALLRCLIDKVVAHRSAPDRVHCRVVWKGGETTTTDLSVPVGTLARLSNNKAMEAAILKLARRGRSDEAIADQLTKQGHRSPMHRAVLPSTVQKIRLRHRLLVQRSQAHPRHIAGYLTVSQIAKALHLTPHWIYDRIHNGMIQVDLDAERQLYLFPDRPRTLTLFKQLRAGKLQNLRF